MREKERERERERGEGDIVALTRERGAKEKWSCVR